MLVADTSALYALFDARDAHHGKARTEAARQRPFTVPSEVLIETLGLVEHRVGAQAAREALAGLRRMRHARLATTRQPVFEAALQGFEAGGPLSLDDWIVVATCQASGAEPWSYDLDLKRAWRR
jgi:predicted nucleic acid-binding protein